MSTAVSKAVVNEGQALMTRAKTLAAQSTDADAKWDAVLWPPPR